MNIHMQETLKGKTHTFDTELDVSSLVDGRRDVIRSSPLKVRLEARSESGAVQVEGGLDIDLEMSCSRCLKPTTAHIAVPFQEQFKPASAVTAAEVEEDEVIPVDGEWLNLQPYVEQALLLELPFAPLCGEDCKGLCAECGSDLNEGECGCSREVIDPRLAGLKDFFKS
ncbi:YceD family protein [Paenibacillus tarimensis]|uniref:YceD family protein n=1 Tax=Paenibacillus tarimensis TaxID=416012 RepID=UPI001F1FF118|nr:DUF177 domain-containing protein [Paenibacillus tarimensis]MCF2942264.1 DUF177 domain-containing protein [Paenibacillus tarimensis]